MNEGSGRERVRCWSLVDWPDYPRLRHSITGQQDAVRWGRPRLQRSFRLQEADMRPAGQPTRVDRKVPVWGHPERLLGQPDQRLPVNWRR